MRIESVNSFLSSIPSVDFRPVHRVGSQTGEQAQVPTEKPVRRTQVHVFDTSSKAEEPYFPLSTRPIQPNISKAEQQALQRLIDSQKRRTDYLEAFPGLLKV